MRKLICLLLSLVALNCNARDSNRGHADNEIELENEATSEMDYETEETENNAQLRFIQLNGNNFVAGENYFEPSSLERINTRIYVIMTYSFEISTIKITQRHFKEIMGYYAPDFGKESSCGGLCPAWATWHEAALFANRLSSKANLPQCFTCTVCSVDTNSNCVPGSEDYHRSLECKLKSVFNKTQDCPGYRLPTAAEWEYAARGGTTTEFYGNLDDIAWYNLNSGKGIDGGYLMHPVGLKKPNRYDLYDILGNSSEWIYDKYINVPDNFSGKEIFINPPDENDNHHFYSTKGCFSGSAGYECNPGKRRSDDDDKTANMGFRLARTLKSVNNAPDDPVPYTKETFIEKTLPSPYNCAKPQGYAVDTPELSWVNPFPNPYFSAPLSVVGGMPFYYTHGGAVYWPSRIPWTDRLYPQSQGAVNPLAAVSAWGKLWVGNNSGGIWQANTGEGMWETVTEMSGSAPYSLLYDEKNDRLVGWYFCDLFLRSADGGSDIRHFYIDLPSIQYQVDNHACLLDGQTTSVKGRLGTFKGDVYQYTKIVKYDKKKSARPYHLQGALFKLAGEEFKHVCTIPLPDLQDSAETAAWIAKPFEDGDRLLLAGVPGQIWQYDGSNCSKIYESQIIGVGNVAQSLAKIDGALYVMTKDKVYRFEGDALTEELSLAASPNAALVNMAVDTEKKILYVGGAKTLDVNNPNTVPYLAAKAGGKWNVLSRDITDYDKQDHHLTTVSIGKNGKGAAGGYFGNYMQGALLRFDGNDWYVWAGNNAKKYDVMSVYTYDGDTVWFATRREIFRASDKDGIVKESIPYTKGRYFNALIGDKSADEFYAIGEWGLLWKHTKEGWIDLNVNTTLSMLGGAVYKGELYVSADESHLGAGDRLFVLKNNQLVELAIPQFAGGQIGRKNPVYDSSGVDYVFKSIFLTVDLRDRLWMARDDGIWLFNDADTSWTAIAGTFEQRDLLGLATSAFAPCGDGVCKVGAANVTGMAEDSYIDIVRPDKEDSSKFELLRRQFTYSQYSQPLAADVINKDRTVFVGSFGEIIEYGKWLPMPCATPDSLKIPLTDYPDDFDFASFYSYCQSPNIQETPQCAEGECLIPEGDYCVGATKAADMQGLGKAGEYPAASLHIASFYIDENYVARGQYIRFVNAKNASERPKYLIFDLSSEYYKSAYDITITDNSLLSAGSPDLSVDFAAKYGAAEYCASLGKRLCKAAEWEAACRGNDDYPFPENGRLYIPDGASALNVASDFGVRGMGILHYEYVEEDYSHDSLRAGTLNYSATTFPMVKGGMSVIEMACWSRGEPYYPAHPMNLGFRCCKDHP